LRIATPGGGGWGTAGFGIREPGVRSQESEVRSQEPGARSRESEGGR
jgi:hypothetical protein